MNQKHTPGDWRYRQDIRVGESGNKHADLFIIESDERSTMATLEVWELNRDPKWRTANPKAIAERIETMVEVEANAKLMCAAPNLAIELERTTALALELMDRAARIDRMLCKAMNGHRTEPDCELGEVSRLRVQIDRNRKAFGKAGLEEFDPLAGALA